MAGFKDIATNQKLSDPTVTLLCIVDMILHDVPSLDVAAALRGLTIEERARLIERLNVAADCLAAALSVAQAPE